jgi:hypothetical protein
MSQEWWSLWDMLKVYGTAFLDLDEAIRQLERLAEPIRPAATNPTLPTPLASPPQLITPQPSAPVEVTEPATPPPPPFADYVSVQLNRVAALAQALKFKRTLSQLGHMAEYMQNRRTRAAISAWRDERLPHDLRFLRQSFNDDLSEQPIYLPSASKGTWYAHEKPFGDTVYNAFPTLRQDLKDAGNCFATDNSTGCVFHLMRVVEQAFRILARKLRVSNLKPDLDYEDFKRIYSELNEKLKQLRNSKRGKKREAEINFYADVADRCQYFKEMWRDNVMHSRKTYESDQAAAILSRVQELMNRLAERLTEPA